MQVSDQQLSNLSISFSPDIIGSVARPVKIVLPAAAFKSVVKERVKHSTGQGSVRSSFVWYRKNLLFDSPENITSIVSADLGLNIPIHNLAEPVVIKHDGVFAKHGLSPANEKSLTVNKTQLSCVYWDFDTGSWKTDGCWLNYTSDKPVCLCSHLTNFALLVTTIQVPSGTALSVVSDIGCVISIVGLLLTIIVFCDTRNRRPAKIILKICCILLIAYFIFVVGVAKHQINRCKVVAVLLHYFLTTWCWMSVYSYDMYMSLVKVFHKSQHQFLQRTSLFAYVVPFVIVVTCASVTMGYLDLQNEVTPYGILEDPLKSSSYISDHMCWLRGNSLYFSFLLPVGMMLIFNIFVFVSVSRELALKNKSATSPNLKRSTKQSLTIAVTMTSLMGLTWVLGYFILISTDVIYVTVFSWLFALFNTLQGFFIFYLTSVRRSDMRSVWLRPFRSYRSSDLSADNVKSSRSKSTYSLKETAAADSTEKTRKTTFTQI
ncbi:LOW QUALITY PROTEIN: adhesion G-protein coupled receptor G7-like [Ciona intestinalis]